MNSLTRKRWEAEKRRAAELGLLTTAQAAKMMKVPAHMVKHWAKIGLIADHGGSGKGHPSLYDPAELRTAPARRKNLRVGWRGRPATIAELNAQKRMRQGRVPSVPTSSPFRMLAFSCRQCGEFVTCRTPHKSARRSYYPHACYVEAAREAGRRPERIRAGQAAAQRANAETLDTATRNGYQWTGPELEIVDRTDLTDEQKARMLGRTIFAVRTQRQQLKIDPRKQRLLGKTQ